MGNICQAPQDPVMHAMQIRSQVLSAAVEKDKESGISAASVCLRVCVVYFCV